MGILSRYVFRQTAGALVLILVSLTGVTWIAVALRQLELMTTQGQDVLRFLSITSLAIPSMIALIAPIALLIGTLYVLNKLSGDSELIVMTAGTMPVWSLLKPLGLLAVLVAAGVTVVNHWVGPWSQQLLRELAAQVRTDLMSQVIQPWRFTSPEQKLTVHIRDRAENGELLGLLMHDARDPKQVATYLAERGLIIKQDGVAYLRMDKGHIVRRLENQAAPEIIVFDRYTVDLNQLEQRADQATVLKPRERYSSDLLRPAPDDPLFRQAPGRFIAELHDRLASPLYAPAFVLLVLAFMGQAQTTRHNRMQAVVAAFTIATGCRIMGIGAANTAVIRPTASALLYVVPVGAGLIAALATHWRTYPRKQSRLERALSATIDRMWARLKDLAATAAGLFRSPRPARRARG
jgi:lipopolysaccharide export system permease protein